MQHVVTSSTFKALFRHISWNGRYRGFTIGVVGFMDVVFFISIAAFFVCLTALVLERRKW